MFTPNTHAFGSSLSTPKPGTREAFEAAASAARAAAARVQGHTARRKAQHTASASVNSKGSGARESAATAAREFEAMLRRRMERPLPVQVDDAALPSPVTLAAKPARLKDLCLEDKRRVAGLVAQVVSLQRETARWKSSCEEARAALAKHTTEADTRMGRLREQNAEIVADNAQLRSKLAHALGLLRQYQRKLEDRRSGVALASEPGPFARAMEAKLRASAPAAVPASVECAATLEPTTSPAAFERPELVPEEQPSAEGRRRILRFDPSVGATGRFFFEEVEADDANDVYGVGGEGGAAESSAPPPPSAVPRSQPFVGGDDDLVDLINMAEHLMAAAAPHLEHTPS